MYTLIGIINLLLLAEPRRNTRKPPTVLTGLSGSWFPGGYQLVMCRLSQCFSSTSSPNQAFYTVGCSYKNGEETHAVTMYFKWLKNNDSLAATCLISDSWEHQLGPPASSPICSCAQLSSYHDGRCQPALKKGVNNNTHEQCQQHREMGEGSIFKM